MDNPCKKKVVFSVDYHDLDDYIAERLNLPNFEGTLESNNDSTHEYEVTAKPDDSMAEWNEPDLQKIIANKSCEYWRLHLVLDHMCRLGFLEEGDYIVSVCW